MSSRPTVRPARSSGRGPTVRDAGRDSSVGSSTKVMPASLLDQSGHGAAAAGAADPAADHGGELPRSPARDGHQEPAGPELRVRTPRRRDALLDTPGPADELLRRHQ